MVVFQNYPIANQKHIKTWEYPGLLRLSLNDSKNGKIDKPIKNETSGLWKWLMKIFEPITTQTVKLFYH